MRAILVKKGWISDNFKIQDIPVPEIKDDEVLISVCAVGVQKHDSDNNMCPGFECSGTIEALGRYTENWKVGDKVCSIIERGGYAEKVAVAANFLLPVPAHMPLEDAATLPYALCTVWLALYKRPDQIAVTNEYILIHEGACKIGLLAIKVAKHIGMDVIVTTGSDQDIQVCLEYGADECINYQKVDVLAFVNAKTGLAGVSFVLDFKGSNLKESLQCCAFRGRVRILKLDGLGNESISLGTFVVLHSQIKAINFQKESLENKALVVDGVRNRLWPVVDKFMFSKIHKFPMMEASKAHKFLRETENKTCIIILYNDFKERDLESQELRKSGRPKSE